MSPVVHPRWLLLCLLVPAGLACSGGEQVPTCVVTETSFQHRVTAEGTLQAERTTVVSVPPEVQRMVRLAWVVPDGSIVEEGQVVARFDPGDMEELLEEGEQELGSANLEVAKSKAESSNTLRGIETDLKMAKLELQLAQRFKKTDDSIFSRHDIIESDIDERLASEREEHATDSREIQERLATTKLELLEIKERKAQIKIDQAWEGLQALEVRAPHSGLFILSRNWRGEAPRIGSEMWKGQEIAQIPDLSKMEAEVFVLEADAGGLEVGKTATVVVEAHPEHSYNAVIKRVDAVAKQRVRSSPVQYFGVTLELETTDPAIMRQGYRVRATLLLEDLAKALVVPRQAVHQDDGAYTVFVKEGRRFRARQVEVKAASLGLLAITGVEAGEQVALREPYSLDEDENKQKGKAKDGAEAGTSVAAAAPVAGGEG